mmetsp:Transcript_90779/g.290967  ORF Transcript_90779/g.290967 Transcript_90779/m.290967 type:complete len:136 (-) Transcript_90779:1548-1955(-)
MTLLTAAPLQMLFGADCLEEAFNLWMAQALRPDTTMFVWDEDLKNQTLKSLFSLFDTNADGSVDAEELRVTLCAFGLELPEGSELHLQVVRHFDRDGDGTMDLSEFKSFVESRIRAVFLLICFRPGLSEFHYRRE